MPATCPYDDFKILEMINGMGKGNPGSDKNVVELLSKIAADPADSGLSNDVLEKVRAAIKPQMPSISAKRKLAVR